MKPLFPVSVGVACAALAAGVVVTDGLGAGEANAAKPKPVTQLQLKKTNAQVKKALQRTNAQAKRISTIEALLAEPRPGIAQGGETAGVPGRSAGREG